MAPKCRTPHFDPPEKGRKAWLCEVVPGANREGSNICRNSIRVRTGTVKPFFQLKRAQDSQRCWSRGISPSSLPQPSYLWVGPHLWVVVKAIKGKGDLDSCGAERREKDGSYTCQRRVAACTKALGAAMRATSHPSEWTSSCCNTGGWTRPRTCAHISRSG